MYGKLSVKDGWLGAVTSEGQESGAWHRDTTN